MMFKNCLVICVILFVFRFEVVGQALEPVEINFAKKETAVIPGQIITLPFFTKNNSNDLVHIEINAAIPKGWNVITRPQPFELKNSTRVFSILTVQVPSNYPVGKYSISINALDAKTKKTIVSGTADFTVKEIEKITMQLVESPEHAVAGENIKASYLLQNLGNTTKKIFIETQGCDVENGSEVKLTPGESARISVVKQTSDALEEVKKDYFTVRALISGRVIKSIFRSVVIFPVKNKKIDLFHRLPVSLSATYLSTNQNNKYESAYQFELKGSGPLDVKGNHYLEFLARGPNSSNLSFLGMYDQYYISYHTKNIESFIGEKAYTFTPLTESSRFGFGTEQKLILNNGLSFGFLYVKPKFYESISNEMAFFSQFEKNKKNSISLYTIAKKNNGDGGLTYITSLSSVFEPFKSTSVDLEISRGLLRGVWSNAFRTNVNTQFSIFRLAGNYYFTGKNYPGYFSNSTFYSATFSVQLSSKINVGIYAKQDFMNAQLDTFFVTAPFTNSKQAFLNYNINRTFLKVYWREFERKDRLSLNKFHYNTNSLNAQLTQKYKKTRYILYGEYGNTTNQLLEQRQNQQTTYRASANFAYQINSKNTIKLFGSWSNINTFISGVRRNVTGGLSVNSQIAKNLRANLHVQNAYDIDDYYRNRNLMQLNINYNFLKHHTFSFRSFYTLFKQKVDNPEFTVAATYTYRFGIPLKQIIKAGNVKGIVTNDEGLPVEGVVVSILNKSSLTNPNGEFRIESVAPGKHLLQVDRSKFQMNEITNIPTPLPIEVLEDQTTTINFKITKGVKINGSFVLNEKKISGIVNVPVKPENIVIELKGEFDEYRTTTGANGEFSFPFIRPGAWTFKIYGSSIPQGYKAKQLVYSFNFIPGEERTLQFELTRHKRNIIFKPSGIGTQPLLKTTAPTLKTQKTEKKGNGSFYSIQVGAFRKKLSTHSKYFKGEKSVFEKQIGRLHKFFIGEYLTRREAEKELKRLRLKFKKPFIIFMKNGVIATDDESNLKSENHEN